MNLKRLISIFIVIIVMCFTLPVTSCEVELDLSTLRLEVGQLYDLSCDISGTFNLRSSNDAVSVIGGSVLKAEREGEAKITVTKGLKKSEIRVFVDYAPASLEISCPDPYVTEVGSILNFVASVGVNANPRQDIYWLVDGQKSGEGSTFDFYVPDYGNYVISAICSGQKKSIEVVCFASFETEPTASVLSAEYNVGDEVTLFTECEKNSVVMWFVNGELIGSGARLSYQANVPGDYIAYALVNGVETNSVDFSVYGTPYEVICDFDSSYPHVFLRWKGAATEYEITVGGKVYDGSSPRMSEFCFDLSDLIDLSKKTKLSVKAVNYGDPVEIYSPELNMTELEYLQKSYFFGNYYMTSDNEVFDIVDYAMAFRNGKEKIELELVMGYTSELSPALLLCNAWLRTEQTGVYRLTAQGSTEAKKLLVFTIECFTDNKPDDLDTLNKPTYSSLSTPNFRGGLSVLPIDNLQRCKIASSEQLCYAVSKGYCPEPTNDRIMEIYQKARNVLFNIISDEMTDEQKVRAVFEWIMWSTNYDYIVSDEANIYDSVLEPAYYLEGVFMSGFAVCDGIAKAFSLMCNMLGIPCVRVVGVVTQGNEIMHHAWNKVLLGGKWYLIDATWSDALISINNKTYEGGSHNYYLLSDAEAIDHMAAFDDLDPKAYVSYDYYEKNDRDLKKENFDSLITCIEREKENAVFETTDGYTFVDRDFYCIEIKISKSVENFYKYNYTQLVTLLKGVDGYKGHSIVGGMIFVVVGKI